MHNCPVQGCETEIERDLFMCLPHWRQVPPRLRGPIRTGYRHYQHTGEWSEAYQAATQEAIRLVSGGAPAR